MQEIKRENEEVEDTFKALRNISTLQNQKIDTELTMSEGDKQNDNPQFES